ncbi:hypothetical protein ABZT17_03230 [Streptomyces sp. NPDC005648]|uniref:hypothetical protein n=1 Tax=Streptomyces sp. NPDC005648 TaxID=3157044 RepID=UPI0033A4044F
MNNDDLPEEHRRVLGGTHLCQGPYGRPEDGADCPDPARFEVLRHRQPALPVCPVHLGPSLLMADDVLWPPQITLVR